MPNLLIGETFEVVKELGRGGMGVVYQARDQRNGQMVAIKELLLGTATSNDDVQNMVARFQREAQAASKLEHPNIVRVYAYLHEGDHHYMVMELLEGKSVQAAIDARHTFSAEQTVDIGAQLCSALDYAHSQKIVHRDIKPDNVILLANGKVKLMDFGVARHTGEVSKLTQAGTTLGTIAYISPEQLCDSRLVDGRSDLFSLGAMLYEMLTLRTPFEAGNVGATIMKIMGEDPVSPRQMNPAIPPKLDAVIMRSLRKTPDERFPRAAEMGAALVATLRPDAAPARPVPPAQPMVTCRGCGSPMADGRSPCPKCGRLQAPPPAGTAPGMQPPGAPPRPGMPPRPGATGPLTGPLSGPGGMPPRPGTGQLGTGPLGGRPAGAPPPRPGFPPRGATGPLNRAGRPVVGARFLYAIGGPGSAPGQFQQPRGLAFDAKGHLHVADTENGRIQVLDAQGNFLREVRPAAGRESFRFPRSVAIMPNNNKLYVVDEVDFRIFVFDDGGRQLQAWDRRRTPTEAVALPGRLAISPSGNIFVSEPNNRRVSQYTSTHMFTASLGAGDLQTPFAVAVGPKGMLYALDTGLCRVQPFDSKGKAQPGFGRRGAAPGELSMPRDLHVDRGGTVFVADTLNHRVCVFDAHGQMTCAFGQKGKGDGQFAGPEGLAVSADDMLFVSDRGNNRIQVFQLERA